ncbi:hypothetical protein HD806DRAFT_475230 [Xylariaceae sp. AK1471]|nr:hypothetical protein HD806DRAFT_475230 [Xylariaceae sp. AK1471]
MSSAHEVFKALGPIDWESFANEDPRALMTGIFSDARCLIDSIPVPLKDELQKTGRPRAVTDTDLPSLPNRAPKSSDQARELKKEWKEVKVNARENPLGLNVYKLAAKDGRGAWFARRSVHEGPNFERWKTGMEREFAESLKVQGQPGDGKIRGLGADKRVVDETVDDCGKAQVYQLSAQFPGPTTPRDFVTLCLSSDTAITTPMPNEHGKPRYFMLVSKPCVHPECPQRQGYIRGYYESVEFIREIKVHKPLRKTRSSVDIANEEMPSSIASGSDSVSKEDNERGDTVIEWVMITRSDPGGSVPRFMIERGTPPGIANDANKFWQWISSNNFDKLLDKDYETTQAEPETTPSAVRTSETTKTSIDSKTRPPNGPRAKSTPVAVELDGEEPPGPGGVYGMISGALGIVASAAASRLLGSTGDNESESEISSPDESDDASSIHSFHSFGTAQDVEPSLKVTESEEPTPSISTGAGADSLYSAESTTAHSSQHDKELRKLEERRRKTEEKLQRAQERALAKKNDDAQRDDLALQKLREKHEREIAKQEEKYQRERRKIETKRAHEEKKAKERQRKQAEREDKANLALELDKTRAERDIARKEIEILKEQVGQLQGLNTKLVARLGREGISLGDDLTPNSGNGGFTPSTLRRSVTELELEQKLDSIKS